MMRARQDNEPRYVEAYPRINLVTAEAALSNERPICNFYNQLEDQVGQCILEPKDDAVLLAYAFQRPDEFREPDFSERHFELLIPVELARGGIFGPRFYFRCPGCNTRVAMLVFKREWKCRACFRLVYRRQLIPKNLAAADAIPALMAEIGAGRPAGMHQKTYAWKRQELDWLRAQARGPSILTASLAHRRVISAKWLRTTELAEPLWLENHVILRGQLVRTYKGCID